MASLTTRQAGLTATNDDLQAQLVLLLLQAERDKNASLHKEFSEATGAMESVTVVGSLASVDEKEIQKGGSTPRHDTPTDSGSKESSGGVPSPSNQPQQQQHFSYSIEKEDLKENREDDSNSKQSSSSVFRVSDVQAAEAITASSDHNIQFRSSSSGRYSDPLCYSTTTGEALGLGSRLSDFHLLMEDVKLSIRALDLHLRGGDESSPSKHLAAAAAADNDHRDVQAANRRTPSLFSSPAPFSSTSSSSSHSSGGSGGGRVTHSHSPSQLQTSQIARHDDSYWSDGISSANKENKKLLLEDGAPAMRKSPPPDLHAATATATTTSSIHDRAFERDSRATQSPSLLSNTALLAMEAGPTAATTATVTDRQFHQDPMLYSRAAPSLAQQQLFNSSNHRYDVNDSIFFHSDAGGDEQEEGEEGEGQGGKVDNETSSIRRSLLAKKRAHRAKFRSDLAAMADNGSLS